MTTTARKRSRNVTLGVTALAASMFLTGCGETADYAAICVDPETEQRLDDDECEDVDDDYDGSGGGFFWFYMATNSSQAVPAVGSSTSGLSGTYRGSTLTSSGKTVVKGGAPTAGAKSFSSYSKSGGFGTSRGFSSS